MFQSLNQKGITLIIKLAHLYSVRVKLLTSSIGETANEVATDEHSDI